jgi:hypothetical protein
MDGWRHYRLKDQGTARSEIDKLLKLRKLLTEVKAGRMAVPVCTQRAQQTRSWLPWRGYGRRITR